MNKKEKNITQDENIKETKKFLLEEQNEEQEDSLQNKKVIQNENIDDTEIIEKKDFINIKYESFESKLSKQVILAIFTLILSLGTIYYGLNNTNKRTISYTQSGNVDYKVCLKENAFYKESCLDKNMTYISSLIKDISLTFNYNLNTSEKFDVDTEYEIAADLVISNAENTSKYYEQKYILQDKTSEGISKINNNYVITKKLDIDYDYYNTIASTFKSQYGVEANSYLEISFQIFHTNKENEDIKVPSPNPVVLNIPLSQKSININMTSSEINKQENQNIESGVFSLTNIICLFIGAISLVICLISSLKVAKMLSLTKEKKNNYDKFIEKILREYDRLIVETSTLPKFNKYYITKVNNFGELIDVRDNLRLPIMYYEVAKHQKCHLYILNNKNLYLLTLKAVDMEDKKK